LEVLVVLVKGNEDKGEEAELRREVDRVQGEDRSKGTVGRAWGHYEKTRHSPSFQSGLTEA
jgi:hypothetical protein